MVLPERINELVSKQETNDFDDTNIKQLSNYTHDEQLNAD